MISSCRVRFRTDAWISRVLREVHAPKLSAGYRTGPLSRKGRICSIGMEKAGRVFQLKSLPTILISACALLAAISSRGQNTNDSLFINTNNFFNWETAPVHPVALSPDGTRLVVCNLPDARVEVFDVTSGQPVSLGSIPVGIDPVTVRFRTTNELWVANYISRSISVVDLATLRVFNTIATSNQPS